MKNPILLLFLLFVLCHGFDSLVDLIPSRLEGKTRGESVHVADIKFGTPRKTLRTGLDFASDTISTIQVQDEDVSSTYTPAGGGSDLMWIAGKRLRLPVTTDPLRVETLCGRCEGLIGVGPSSPLWIVWKEATFGSGVVSLGNLADIVQDADWFNRLEEPSQLDNDIQCTIGFTDGLCKTTALVGPDKDLATVIFTFDERRTLLSDPVWDAYTAGKNVETTSTEGWGDLEFDFIDLTPASPDTIVRTRIRAHDIVSDSPTGEPQLNLGLSGSNTTIYIGRTAFRSFFVHMRWVPNTINVINWRVEKSYSVFIAFVLLGIGISLVWWKGTRTGMWSIHWNPRSARVLAIFFFTFVCLATIWVGSTRNAIREFLLVDIFFQLTIYGFLLITWGCVLIHLLMRYGYGRNTRWYYSILGMTYAEETFVMEHEMHQRAHGTQGGSSTGHALVHKESRLLNMLSFTSNGSIGSKGPRRSPGKPIGVHAGGTDMPWSTYVWYNANVGSQRIWSVITFCVDMILFSTLFLAWNTTREDTLTGIGSLLLFSFMIVLSAYHLISHFYHRSGHHALAWYAFVALNTIHLLLLVLLAEVYIYYPFIHRFVPDYSSTPSIITFLFTLGLFYFAESIAKARVSKRGILYHYKDSSKGKNT
jgi:hypothetical protein